MHTRPTKQLSRIFDRIVESECPVAVLYDRINDKFVTAKTNTPKWIEVQRRDAAGPASRWRLYALHQDRRSAR